MHSWRISILPYLEQENLFRAYSYMEPWDGPNNQKLAERMPPLLALSGDYQPGLTTTNYVVAVGEETAFPPHKSVKMADVGDGTSNTILIAENRGAGIHWMEPRDLTLADMDLTINSPRGVSSKYKEPAVVMLDGSVRRLSRKLAPETLHALFTINGKERLTEGRDGWELLPDGRDRPLADR